MTVETMMWLLVVVFMFHDFEEIIMMIPWAQRNQAWFDSLSNQKLAVQLRGHFAGLSTSSLTIAVAEEFVVLTVLTWVAIELRLYAAWVGLLLVFAIHLAVHAGQFIALRRYVPVILTTPLAAAYCVYALLWFDQRRLFQWNEALGWALPLGVVVGINLIFALKLAKWFEAWLRRYIRAAEPPTDAAR